MKNNLAGRPAWVAAIVGMAVAAALVVGLDRRSNAATGLNLVYVETNLGCGANMGANNNSIAAFSNTGGILTPVAGSPFLTGGSGVCDPGGPSTSFDADGQVVVQPDGSLLYAVNGHSNSIAVMTINSDGSLTPIGGSPFASGGSTPASIGLAYNIFAGGGSQMTIANRATDPNQTSTSPNFAMFNVSAGVPTAAVPATLGLKSGAGPSQLLPKSSLRFMFGLQFNISLLKSWQIKANGTLSPNTPVNPPVSGDMFLGMALHPIYRVLYAAIVVPSAQIGVYTYDKTTGQLAFNKAVADSGSLPCWLVTNAAGTFLYSSETGSGTIGVWDISHYLTPVQKADFVLNTSQGGGHPSNIAFDPTGKYLYVVDPPLLHVLNVAADGSLSETSTPTTIDVKGSGETPVGVATVMK